MSENVDNFVLEHLRGIHADMARLADRQDTIGAELLVIRQHIAGPVGSQVLDNTKIAAFEARLERIGRRPELID